MNPISRRYQHKRYQHIRLILPYAKEVSQTRGELPWAERAQAEMLICEKYLALWNADDIVNKHCSFTTINQAKSWVRCRLAQLLFYAKQDKKAEIQFDLALDEAYKSQSFDAIHHVLTTRGTSYYLRDNGAKNRDERDKVIDALSRSLPYASGLWPHSLIRSLDWLAGAWGKDDETVHLTYG
ncbi:MAG: hypothetical protein JWQ02_4295, partial [Capsulimonas sp.]|nr:hypothetical protein [Capsulimonas sp.]